MKTCPSCKETYGDDKNFCRKCGAAVSAASTDRPMSPEFLARRHIFEAKIAKDPEATELLTSYGDYLLSESLVDDAIVQYIRALDTVPNDEEIGLRLVKAYHLGRHYHDKAIANALIFLDSHPDSVRLRDELASLYLELGKFPSAAQLLLELTKLEPSNPDHFVRRLDVLRKIPDCQDEILETCRALHKDKPFQYPACNFYLGMSISASSPDDNAELLSQAEKMLADAMSQPDVLSEEEQIACKLRLVKTRLKLKRDFSDWLDDLQAVSSKSLSSSQRDELAECWLLAGKAQLEAAKADAAIESFNKSLEIIESAQVRNLLAKAYQLKGENLLKAGEFGSPLPTRVTIPR